MKTKTLTAFACMAWLGVAISSATPAHARLATTQAPASYASCGNQRSYSLATLCGIEFSTTQFIKMLGTSCGQGGCSSTLDYTYVEFEYTNGRHTATYQGSCGSYSIIGLDSCAC